MCIQVMCPSESLTLAEFPLFSIYSHICFACFCKKKKESAFDIVNMVFLFIKETCDNI